MGDVASAKSSRPLKNRPQVAAVCYRTGRRGVEFLLVQSRGGRWIFPKGGVEPGMTGAQSAALEAFEEAGVHGRIEEIPFARYFRRDPDASVKKKNTRPGARSSQAGLAIIAYLCEVSRLEPPQESNRNPSWFLPEKTKQRLLKDREPKLSAELVRVVDRALLRIERMHRTSRQVPPRAHTEGLLSVRFEANEDVRFRDDVRRAALARYILRQGNVRSSSAIDVARQANAVTVPQIGPRQAIRRPVLRLGSGTHSPTETGRNITAIDSGRRRHPGKPGKFPSGQR